MPKKSSVRTKRIYISDVHMSAGKESTGKKTKGKNKYSHDWIWLGPKEANKFVSFLKYLYEAKDVKEIILLGDIMDDWVCPVDMVPPTFDDIIRASNNSEIVKYLKLIGKHEDIKVIYMPGNHDMSITRECIEKNFPGIVFGGSAANDSIYRTSRLLAEHGSAHALFNAPDPVNNPRNRLPLGYFISRVVATKAAKTGSPERHYWTYIDDFLELLGPQKMPESVFEAILEEADLPEDVEISMHPVAGKKNKVNAKQIKERYANIYDQWQTHHGPGMAFKAVMAEIGWLGDLADTLSKKSATRVIIFGHSHDSELDKDSWFVKDRIYANCGSWSDEQKPQTFVETEKDKSNRRHYVRLKAWEKGNVKTLGEEWIDI